MEETYNPFCDVWGRKSIVLKQNKGINGMKKMAWNSEVLNTEMGYTLASQTTNSYLF